MKVFSTKFIDIMLGVMLGLGFQWWPNLHEPWQKVAFVFVYIDLIDYWIDYDRSLKKFPPKKEFDLILDVAIIFAMFMYISFTQYSLTGFIVSFIAFRAADILWLINSKFDYKPTGSNKVFIDTWVFVNIVEIACSLALVFLLPTISPLIALLIFILFRVIARVIASSHYKRIYL